MGLFKDLKKLTEASVEMQKTAEKLQQQHATGQSGSGQIDQQLATANALNNAQPYDEGAPELAPVNGVSLERYAQIAYETQHLGADDAARAQYVESQGLVPGSWIGTSQEWSSRMASDPRLNKSFNKYWQKASRRGR
jgi:hypothetical protein